MVAACEKQIQRSADLCGVGHACMHNLTRTRCLYMIIFLTRHGPPGGVVTGRVQKDDALLEISDEEPKDAEPKETYT